MGYLIKEQKSIKKEIKSILNEELDGIEQHLQATTLKHKAIHETRKSFKRIRALLRLIRGTIGEKRFVEENNYYRDIARKISAIRDVQALLEAWKDLKEYAPEDIPDETYQQVHDFLMHRRRQASYQILQKNRAMDEALEQVRSHRQKAIDLPFSGNGLNILAPGLKKVSGKGTKRLKLVKSTPSMEHIHDWRKRVKYLLHHIQLLSICWKEMMDTYAGEIKTLSDHLGLWRDLGLLENCLAQSQEIKPHIDMPVISAMITSYQLKLLHASLSLGEKIYQEKPDNFMQRIHGYWESSKKHTIKETNLVNQ